MFLVGCAHAYKSDLAGFASAGGDGKEELTAGAQLTQRLGPKNVFSIFQHVMTCDNSGGHRSLIRGGIFDQAFTENGNNPVGFLLQDSPFGKEPFDGIYEIKYKNGAGTYQDNRKGRYEQYFLSHCFTVAWTRSSENTSRYTPRVSKCTRALVKSGAL